MSFLLGLPIFRGELFNFRGVYIPCSSSGYRNHWVFMVPKLIQRPEVLAFYGFMVGSLAAWCEPQLAPWLWQRVLCNSGERRRMLEGLDFWNWYICGWFMNFYWFNIRFVYITTTYIDLYLWICLTLFFYVYFTCIYCLVSLGRRIRMNFFLRGELGKRLVFHQDLLWALARWVWSLWISGRWHQCWKVCNSWVNIFWALHDARIF